MPVHIRYFYGLVCDFFPIWVSMQYRSIPHANWMFAVTD